MSNYTKDNLLAIAKEDVPIGSLAIKIGSEVFPLTIGKGGGGSADFYQCAEVFGPSKVSGFVVSGAGTAAVNGNYLPTDLKTEEDTPIYKHETAEYYYYELWGEKGITTSPTQYPSEGLYYNMYDEGWYSNSGAEPAPTVTAGNIIVNADVPKTWNGYKAVLSGGQYTFETTLTEGLTYGEGYTPTVLKAYNANATITAKLFMPYPIDAILSNCDTLPDNNLTTTNCIVDTNVKKFGEGSIKIQSGGYISFKHRKANLYNTIWTVAHFFYADSYTDSSTNIRPLINNDDDNSGTFFVCIRSSGKLFLHMRGGSSVESSNALTSGWHHIRVTHVGNGVLRAYLDGEFILTVNKFSRTTESMCIGQFVQHNDNTRQFTGNIDGIEFFEIDEERISEYTGSSAPVPEKPF